MSIEEQLKQEILSQYRSVRAFTTEIQIPYSTLDSVFKRGLSKAGIDTMLKVFDALNLDIESIPEGVLRHREDFKKNTSESELTDPEDIPETIEILSNLFIKMGFMAPGGDISDADLEFCKGLIMLIAAYFNKHNKS